MPTAYYLKDTNGQTTCDIGDGSDHDLSKTQGSATTATSINVNDTAFVRCMVFDLDVSADSPATGSHTVNVNINSFSGTVEARWRLVAVDDAGCSNVNTSGYSATYSSTGAKSDSLSLTWGASAERLRLEVEIRRSGGHGNVSITLDVNHANSYVDAPWAPSVTFTPSIESQSADEFSPGLSVAVTLTPSIESQSADEFSPGLATEVTLTPSIESQSADEFDPGISVTPNTLTPIIESQSADEFSPGIDPAVLLSPVIESQSADEFSPGIAVASNTLTPIIESQSADEFSPGIDPSVLLSPSIESQLADEFDPGIDVTPNTLTPAVESQSADEFSPGILEGGGVTLTPTIVSQSADEFSPGLDVSPATLTTVVRSQSADEFTPSIDPSVLLTPVVVTQSVDEFDPGLSISPVVFSPAISTQSADEFSPGIEVGIAAGILLPLLVSSRVGTYPVSISDEVFLRPLPGKGIRLMSQPKRVVVERKKSDSSPSEGRFTRRVLA